MDAGLFSLIINFFNTTFEMAKQKIYKSCKATYLQMSISLQYLLIVRKQCFTNNLLIDSTMQYTDHKHYGSEGDHGFHDNG